MAKTLFFILILCFGNTIFASEGCFHKHLKEAIIINKQRMPIYAELTEGESRKVSRRLISIEKAMLFFTNFIFNFDRLEKPYREKGMQITCEAFVDMSLTPQFEPKFLSGTPQKDSFIDLDSRKIKSTVRKILKTEGVSENLKAYLHEQVDLLMKEPRLNCLARHIFESMAHIANLNAKWKEQAAKLGLKDPEDLVNQMIRSHLGYLDSMLELDHEAMPFQLQGVPIICQDVPPIF